MRILIQRVDHASVEVDQKIVGEIKQGLLVFVGIQKHDDEIIIQKSIEKLLAYRVFSDLENKMNLNVKDIQGELLIVSQFTLAANTKNGLRPSFSSIASPDIAKQYYEFFVKKISDQYPEKIQTGQFAADMKVSLVNDGPVTFVLDF